MYSQSVVFPRLAVIQSAKWKDRNGLWFGFRIIHYAAHNTPSPATAVLHTQSRVGIDHTRALHVRTSVSSKVQAYDKNNRVSIALIHCTITWNVTSFGCNNEMVLRQGLLPIKLLEFSSAFIMLPLRSLLLFGI